MSYPHERPRELEVPPTFIFHDSRLKGALGMEEPTGEIKKKNKKY